MTSRIAHRAGALLSASAAALTLATLTPATLTAAPLALASSAARTVPDYSHIVVVIEENRAYSQIIGNAAAPYINSLASHGALFTRSYGVTYPSQPNYLALLAGSTFGVTSDSCPHTFSAANLGSELRAAGLSYSGYSESMPGQGYQGCRSGRYWRKHNPTADFRNLPGSVNKTFAQFPSGYARLPTVSFVDANLVDDMHSGSVARGDRWLKAHLGGYVTWAKTHNSLLILTWDTDNRSAGNHIPTLFTGAHIAPGRYGGTISHYNVLRTIEQAYGLPHAGHSAAAAPITKVFSG